MLGFGRCWTGEKCPAVMFCDTSSVTPAANCDLRWQNDCAQHTSVIYASLWCCEIRRVTHMCRLHTTKFIIRHFLFTTSCSQYDHAHMQYVYTPCASHIYFISHMLCMLDSILLSYFRPTSQHMNYFFEIPSASKRAAHLYMLWESQTTGYMRARFDRLIPLHPCSLVESPADG